jgi:phosphoglycerol transferase MdoB-like AlkP superfamily enzyme
MFEEKGVVYWAPARPHWLELSSGAALALSTFALVYVLAAKWRRERSLPFTPLIGFLVTIWFWTIYTTLDPLVRYMIPALHSIQYMYFVWLMRRNEARASEGPPLFGPPVGTRLTMLALSALVLGWALFRGVPSLLDTGIASTWSRESTAHSLGSTPFFAAFFLVVNLHHYFMDYVIWRRDNPDTRYLNNDPEPSPAL